MHLKKSQYLILQYYFVSTGPRKPQIFSDFKDEVFTANYKILPVTVGSNITAYGKSLIKLVCNASGIPRPVIEWSKENGKIERKYVKGDYLLLPHNVALSGRYVCTAKNVASETQLESHIQLIGKNELISVKITLGIQYRSVKKYGCFPVTRFSHVRTRT